jgi:hypothetical protein
VGPADAPAHGHTPTSTAAGTKSQFSEAEQAVEAALLAVQEKLALLHPRVTLATIELARAARVSHRRYNNCFEKEIGATTAVTAYLQAKNSLCTAYTHSEEVHAAAMDCLQRALEWKRCLDCVPAMAASAVKTAKGLVQMTGTKKKQLGSQCEKLAKLLIVAEENQRDWLALNPCAGRGSQEPQATRQSKRQKTVQASTAATGTDDWSTGDTGGDDDAVSRKTPLGDLLAPLESKTITLDAGLLEVQRNIPANEPCVAALDFSTLFHGFRFSARDVSKILLYFLDEQQKELKLDAYNCVISGVVSSFIYRLCPLNRNFFDYIVFVEQPAGFLKERARAPTSPINRTLLTYYLSNLHDESVLKEAVDFIHSSREYFCDIGVLDALKKELFATLTVKSLAFVGSTSLVTENDQSMIAYVATLQSHAVVVTNDRDLYLHAPSSSTFYRQFLRVLPRTFSKCCRIPFGVFDVKHAELYMTYLNRVNLEWLAKTRYVAGLEVKFVGNSNDCKLTRALASARPVCNKLRLQVQGAVMAAVLGIGNSVFPGFAFGVVALLRSDYTHCLTGYTTTKLTNECLTPVLVLVNKFATEDSVASSYLSALTSIHGKNEEVLDFHSKKTELIQITLARLRAVATMPLFIMVEVACYLLAAIATTAPLVVLQQSVIRTLAAICVLVPTPTYGNGVLSGVSGDRPFLNVVYGGQLPERSVFEKRYFQARRIAMPEGLKWGFWDRVVEGRPIGAPANNGCCIKIKKKKTFVCLLGVANLSTECLLKAYGFLADFKHYVSIVGNM